MLVQLFRFSLKCIANCNYIFVYSIFELRITSMFYVDDGNICITAFPPGSRFVDGEVKVIEAEIEVDKEIPQDLRTVRTCKFLVDNLIKVAIND